MYDRVEKRFYVRVLFTTFTKAICRVEDSEPEDLDREMRGQAKETENDFEEAELHPRAARRTTTDLLPSRRVPLSTR